MDTTPVETSDETSYGGQLVKTKAWLASTRAARRSEPNSQDFLRPGVDPVTLNTAGGRVLVLLFPPGQACAYAVFDNETQSLLCGIVPQLDDLPVPPLNQLAYFYVPEGSSPPYLPNCAYREYPNAGRESDTQKGRWEVYLSRTGDLFVTDAMGQWHHCVKELTRHPVYFNMDTSEPPCAECFQHYCPTSCNKAGQSDIELLREYAQARVRAAIKEEGGRPS